MYPIPPPRQASTLLKRDSRPKVIIIFQSPQQGTMPPPSLGNLPKSIQVSMTPSPTTTATRDIMDIKILDMGISFHGQYILAALKERGMLWPGIGIHGLVRGVVYIFIKWKCCLSYIKYYILLLFFI
jgi:hypothetical protein